MRYRVNETQVADEIQHRQPYSRPPYAKQRGYYPGSVVHRQYQQHTETVEQSSEERDRQHIGSDQSVQQSIGADCEHTEGGDEQSLAVC